MSLNVTTEMLDALLKIREEKKFVEEGLYPGAPTEEIRLSSERRVNDFLDDVTASLRHGATRDDVFTRSSRLINSFEDEDTEERERVGDYIGSMMRTIGINDWTDFI